MTTKIKGAYKGNLKNELIHVQSGNAVEVDVNNGISPVDLTCCALASCMISMMGFTAQNHNFSIDGTTYDVDYKMSDVPKQIQSIDIIINFPKKYSERQLALLKKSFEGCPVKNSLNKDVIINYDMRFPE